MGALFALILPGLIPMFLMAPTSEVMKGETIGDSLSINSQIMASREVGEFSSSIGIRQDGINHNTLVDAYRADLEPATADMIGRVSVTDSRTSTGLATTSSEGKITLTWNAPTSRGYGVVKSYSVYRGTCSALTDQALIASVTTTSNVDGSVKAGTVYYYTVKAINKAGAPSASPSALAIIKVPPGTPCGLTAVGSNGAVTVSWSAPSSNGGSAITGYKLYRSTVPGSETLVASLGKCASYTDAGLVNGKTYYYRVSAVNAVGEGNLSQEVPGMPKAASAVPGAFSLIASATSGSVRLSWTMPSSVCPLQHFDVIRKVSGSETVIAKLSPSRTSYVDQTAVTGKDYSYRVVAFNSAGPSSTPFITVHALGLGVGPEDTLNLGQTTQDHSPELFAGLTAVVIGAVYTVALFRLRRNQV